MLGFAPIARGPYSSLNIDLYLPVSAVRATVSVGSVHVQASQVMAAQGGRLLSGVGTVSVTAYAQVNLSGTRVAVALGQTPVQADQHLSAQGGRSELRLGVAQAFTGVRVYPLGMRVQALLGQVTARAASDVLGAGARLTSSVGVVEIDARAVVYAQPLRLTATVGQIHLVVTAPQYVTGTRMYVRSGPMRAWGDVPLGTSSAWRSVAEVEYVEDVVAAFGGVPFGSLAFSGSMRRTTTQHKQDWEDVGTLPGEVTNIWRPVAV